MAVFPGHLPCRNTVRRGNCPIRARSGDYVSERIAKNADQGLIDQVACGLYRWADVHEIDQDLFLADRSFVASSRGRPIVLGRLTQPCEAIEAARRLRRAYLF